MEGAMQLERFSFGEGVKSHQDILNCPLPGYNGTGCFSIVFRDAMNDFWSLKFITNSRAECGWKYMPHMMNVSKACGAARRLTGQIDKYLNQFCDKDNGSWISTVAPKWDTDEFINLHDLLPWEKHNLTDIHNKVLIFADDCCFQSRDIFTLPMTTERFFWMSPAVDWIYRFARPTTDVTDAKDETINEDDESAVGRDRIRREIRAFTEDQQLEMALLVSWQCSFTNFSHVCERMWTMDSSSDEFDHPLLLFHKLSQETCGTTIGGDKSRYSVPGIDIDALFGVGEKKSGRGGAFFT